MRYRCLLFSLLLMTVSCGKAVPDEPERPSKADYVGTVTVEYQGSSFDNENISVRFDPSDDGSQASLTIHQIKFVPQMPVTIDVTIPGIALSTSGEKTLLSCGSVVPLAMGGEMPRYQVTDFTGSLKGTALSFSLNFGDYPTSFTGTKSE